MPAFAQLLKRQALPAGIALMFLLTWPIDLANAGLMPFRVPIAVYILLGYGFVIASILMTGLTLGKAGVIALLKRFLIWRVSWKWYLAASLLVPAIDLLALYLNAAWNQTRVDFSAVFAYEIFGPTANLGLLIVPFFLFDALTNGEEIGWRGYVLPRLQARFNALVSTLILGFIWGLWHLPKRVSHWNTASFIWFIIFTMAIAVLYTWLYNSTRGSLLLVTLFHASSNTAGVFLPTESAYIFEAVLIVIAAVLVVVLAGPEHLSRTEPRQVQEREGAVQSSLRPQRLPGRAGG